MTYKLYQHTEDLEVLFGVEDNILKILYFRFYESGIPYGWVSNDSPVVFKNWENYYAGEFMKAAKDVTEEDVFAELL